MSAELQLKFYEWLFSDDFFDENPYDIKSDPELYWALEGYIAGVKTTTKSMITLNGNFKWNKI